MFYCNKCNFYYNNSIKSTKNISNQPIVDFKIKTFQSKCDIIIETKRRTHDF